MSGSPVAAADPVFCGGFDTYRFKVLRSYEGTFGEQVNVVMTCTDKKLAVGRRLLVSSGYYRPDGRAPIASIHYHWTTTAAWLVTSEDDVWLRGYGPDTPWDETPAYLTRPDTLREAVRAVTRPRVPVAPTAEWGPMAVVDDPGADAFGSRIGPGRLEIGIDCVRFVGSSGPGKTLVWRDGQSDWIPGTRRIRLRNVDGTWLVLRDGDRLFLSGYTPPPTDIGNPPLAPWVVRPNPFCPANQWVVHEVDFAG